MSKHLKGCSPYQKSARKDQATTSNTLPDLFNGNGSDTIAVMSRDRLKEAVLRIIVSGNLPFAFADNPEFRKLLHDAYPDALLPNRKSVREYLASRAETSVQDVKARLAANDSKVSIVLDAWTNRSNLSFLGTSPFLRVTGYCFCLFGGSLSCYNSLPVTACYHSDIPLL
jgi:hypothetical protein